MTLGHYLRSMDKLTKMFSTSKDSYRDNKRQRLYMKDIDCPETWAQHLKELIPDSIYYLNDCIESTISDDGSIREGNEYCQPQYAKGVAQAGDLMSSLPTEMQAQNMMCYIGHEGTYTPAHREMCATLGHNIMVEASTDGHGENTGSSLWFMTETSERDVVSEYFLSILGHDIEVEKHFAQINAWKKAPFNVWVVEQKVGDLILIPPLAPHQVWNRGTRTMKAAWNRTTVDTLELAIHEALPRARMVCRDEQYKCKAIIYYTLVNYYELLQRDTIKPQMRKYGRVKQLLDDFKRLFDLYQEILVSEMFSPKLPEEKDVEMLPFDSNVTCSYCRCNIFNRFLACRACILPGENEDDVYDICMDCYAMGRSCACISHLKWVEQWKWSTLTANYELWRKIAVQSRGFDHESAPQTIDIARLRCGKKPIAEVCQEQLIARPWNDITKTRQPTPEISTIEPEVYDEGRLKLRKGRKRVKARGERRSRVQPEKDQTHICHICCRHDWKWKLAFCTTCSLAYCYDTLFRAFDIMPQAVMEDIEWQCPRCLKMCSCRRCRKTSTQTPYQPKGTLLGHDTRMVADYRSVESLVNFSKTNLPWLRDDDARNPQGTGRIRRLKEMAEVQKARVDLVDNNYLNEDSPVQEDPFMGADGDRHEDEMAQIDPELRGTAILSLGANGGFNFLGPVDTADVGGGDVSFSGTENGKDLALDWMEVDLDLSDHDPYSNPHSMRYHLKPHFPPVSMAGPNKTDPESPHLGKTYVRGIGYCQQDNSMDNILYGPSDLDGFLKEPHISSTQDLGLAFSDTLDFQLQAEKSKGHTRNDEGESTIDDMELFPCKQQKSEANTAQKNYGYEEKIVEKTSRLRSIRPKHYYADLGENAAPIEDDKASSVLSKLGCRAEARANVEAGAKGKARNGKTDNSDMAPRSLVKGRLGKANPSKRLEKLVVKKRNLRSIQENPTDSPSTLPASNEARRPKRSTRLAREEALNSKVAISTELPAKHHTFRQNKGGLAHNSRCAKPSHENFPGSTGNPDNSASVEFNNGDEASYRLEQRNEQTIGLEAFPRQYLAEMNPATKIAEVLSLENNEDSIEVLPRGLPIPLSRVETGINKLYGKTTKPPPKRRRKAP